MSISRRIPLVPLVAALILSIGCAPALAAPVTVKLRVEGSTKTLFEGDVATQGETFETKSSGGAHACDYADDGNHEGFTNGGNSSGTPTTALRAGALAAGLPFDAKWSASLGDFFVTQVGSDVEETEEPFDAWGFAVNDTTAPVGGCQIALAPGSEVLWAYNYFNLKHLLSLTGPTAADAGTPFTVHVTDGQTGQPIAGAAVGQFASGTTTTSASSPVTDANGDATVTLTQTGNVTLKATQPESVRSNGLAICVHQGNDGTCGTTIAPKGESHAVSTPVVVTRTEPRMTVHVFGVRDGHTYTHRAAPRLLGGSVDVPAGDVLSKLSISLERSYRGHCSVFDGSRGMFVRAKCHTRDFFTVGQTSSFSYLLPARLPAGRYLYAIRALGGTSPIQSVLIVARDRVVFSVK